MRQAESNLIKKGKIGLLFWIVACFLGSILIVEIERHLFNKVEGFYMPLSDGLLLWFVVTIITLLTSSPIILIIYLLSKRVKKLGLMITTTLVLTFIFAYVLTLYLSRSFFEAFYLTSPYFVFAFILEIIYLKMEGSITSTKSHGLNNHNREARVS